MVILVLSLSLSLTLESPVSELVRDYEDALEAFAFDDGTGRGRITHSGNRGKSDNLKMVENSIKLE